jgi:hypothetical protein
LVCGGILGKIATVEPLAAQEPPSIAGRTDLHFELSLALHTAIARRLNEELLEGARRLVEKWLEKGSSSTPLLERWRTILALPIDEVRAWLTDRSEEAAWLRKASPFAGAIPPREREKILQDTRRCWRSSP